MRDFVNWESRRFIVPLYSRINSFISGVFLGSESRKALGRRGKRLWVEERVLKVPLKSKSISSGSKRCYSFDYSAGSALGRWAEAAARREGTGGLRRLTVAAQSMLHLKID